MTQWIDDLVSKLDTSAKIKNEERSLQLQRAEAIKSLAPQFFSNVIKEIVALTNELDDRVGASLGGVKADVGPGSFAVKTDGIKKIVVRGRLNIPGQQIEVETTVEGPSIMGGGQQETFKLSIDEDNDLVVRSSDGQRFAEGEQLADAIMQKHFTFELLKS